MMKKRDSFDRLRSLKPLLTDSERKLLKKNKPPIISISELGDRLREIRKQFNLSQEQLAEKSGLSKSYISRLENNERIPSFNVLKNLSKSFGMEPKVFLSRDLSFSEEETTETNIRDELKRLDLEIDYLRAILSSNVGTVKKEEVIILQGLSVKIASLLNSPSIVKTITGKTR